MKPNVERLRLIKRLALICAALLLATTCLSAFMRLSQAGLGCADWPACYGAQLRASAHVDGATVAASEPAILAARLAHRVVATLALVLIVTLVMVCWRHPLVTRGQRNLTLALLVLSLGLAALGVVTPGARAPAIPMGNLLGGFVVLALCWRLFTSVREEVRGPAPAGLGPLAVAGLLVLALQLASGALISTSYATLSCADLSTCRQVAAESGSTWAALNPWREPVFMASAPHVNADGAVAQWLHRLGSIVGAAVLALVGALAIRRGHLQSGAILLGLVLAQVLLGLLALSGSMPPLWAGLAHNLVAALLLATLMRLT